MWASQGGAASRPRGMAARARRLLHTPIKDVKKVSVVGAGLVRPPSVTLVPLASAQPPSPIFSTFPRGKVFPPRPPGQLGLSRSRLARPSPRPCRAPRPAAAPAASPHTPAVLQCTPQLISRLPLELLALPPTTHSGVLASCTSPTFPNHYMLLSDKSYSQQFTNHNKSF